MAFLGKVARQQERDKQITASGDPYSVGNTSGVIAAGATVNIPLAVALTAVQAAALQRGDVIIVGWNTPYGFAARVRTSALLADVTIVIESVTLAVNIPAGVPIVNPLWSADYA